ncbi:MAG: ATP-binding protein [Actinomycetota bacterium]
MVQQSGQHEVPPREVHPDSDRQVLMFPTRFATYVPSDHPARSNGGPATRPRASVSKRAIRQVTVLGVAGPLRDVVEDLDRAIQVALADEEARGVVCDLAALLEGAEPVEPVVVEVLASAGRHVRDWPGIPVGVSCPDSRVGDALRAHPLGGHLIVADSLFSAVSAVLATPALSTETLRLAPHPTAPRAARDFVTRTLLGWQLDGFAPSASLVASELVTRSSMTASTAIDLSVVWNVDALRLTVRDRGPYRPDQRHSGPDVHGQGLTLVAGLSRAFGVLPTADGGNLAWAVLDAPRPPVSDHQPGNGVRGRVIPSHLRSPADQNTGRIIDGSHR